MSDPKNEGELKKNEREIITEVHEHYNNLLFMGSVLKQSQQKWIPHLHVTALHPSYRSMTCLHEGHGLRSRFPINYYEK